MSNKINEPVNTSASAMEKLPKNNYMLWLKENRDDISKMYFKDYTIKIVNGRKENIANLVTKKAGEVWKSLDESVKETFTTRLGCLKEKQLLDSLPDKKKKSKSKDDTPPPPYEDTTTSPKLRSIRKSIPMAVRKTVFTKFINTDDPNKLIGECFIGCGKNITIDDFELGHVLAHSMGGKDTIDNLRPICSGCNKSMGNENLHDFKEKYGFNIIEDPDYFKNKIDECISTETSLLSEMIELDNIKDELKENLDEINKSNDGIKEFIMLSKTNLKQIKGDYDARVKDIQSELALLEAKFNDDKSSINSIIKENNTKIKETDKEISGINNNIKLNTENINMVEVKISNVNDTKKKYSEQLVIIELLQTEKNNKLMKELEEEVKIEMEREELKKKIREDLLKERILKEQSSSKNTIDNLITL
jgi:hypothetical protein